MIKKEDVDQIPFRDYRWLHLTGLLPGLSDTSREAAFYLVNQAKANGLTVSFAPTLRPQLWPNRETMIQVTNALADKADYIFPDASDGRILMGSEHPVIVNAFYMTPHAKAVIFKCGGKCAYVTTPQGSFLSKSFPVDTTRNTGKSGLALQKFPFPDIQRLPRTLHDKIFVPLSREQLL